MIWPCTYGGQQVECDSLSENGLHMLLSLTVRFPVGGNVWERLGDVALL